MQSCENNNIVLTPQELILTSVNATLVIEATTSLSQLNIAEIAISNLLSLFPLQYLQKPSTVHHHTRSVKVSGSVNPFRLVSEKPALYTLFISLSLLSNKDNGKGVLNLSRLSYPFDKSLIKQLQ